ncbi:MAG: glycosyltransferase [Lachnospiraceae bacterium]|nr:glycosyltransferase [Lachnospiraceae bacterium]
MTYQDVVHAARQYVEGTGSVEKTDEVFRSYMENPESYLKERADLLEKELMELYEKGEQRDYYFLSAMVQMVRSPRIHERLYRMLLSDESLSKETLYFVYCQMGRWEFVTRELQLHEFFELKDDLYEVIYQKFKNELTKTYDWIPAKERDEKLVFVLSSQVLNLNHGPTKMLFDRAYVLRKSLGKEVMIFNTAELLSPIGEISWFKATLGNYYDEFSKGKVVEFQDTKFPFFQFPQITPSIEMAEILLETIWKMKPWCVVTIGGNSILSDLCALEIPVLTLPTVYSGRAICRSQFQMIGGSEKEHDNEWLGKHHLTNDHFVKEVFTFTFKPQSNTYTRKELGLPEDGMITIACSGRLNEEADEQFMRFVKKLAENGIYTAFAGGFSKLAHYADTDPLMKEYCIDLGYQTDMMGVYECCDVYLNPYRSGGGCSAAEALSKGLPALSMNYGDAGVSVGDDFHFADYEAMVKEAVRLKEDPAYYHMKSEQAKVRAALLTDSARAFSSIMHAIEKRAAFQ